MSAINIILEDGVECGQEILRMGARLLAETGKIWICS